MGIFVGFVWWVIRVVVSGGRMIASLLRFLCFGVIYCYWFMHFCCVCGKNILCNSYLKNAPRERCIYGDGYSLSSAGKFSVSWAARAAVFGTFSVRVLRSLGIVIQRSMKTAKYSSGLVQPYLRILKLAAFASS